MTDDEKISRRYRELGAEEPPRALDEAILAAARREAGARPAALAARGNRQRWYAPLATAAVLVLAVAVALHTRDELPDTGMDAPAPRAAKPAPAQPAAPAPAQPAADSVAKAAPESVRPKAVAPARRAEPPAFAPDPMPQAGPAPAAPRSSASGSLAGASGERAERDQRADRAREQAPAPVTAEAMAKRAPAQALSLAETPERELERIADMRAQGRHDEADRALAEFRRRHPDYRIPEAVRERVERR